jgi:alginate O-acetyltransferase complex protein AlgI
MVFSSLIFIYAFLPACILIYNIAPGIRYKNIALLAVSLAFYALGEPVCVFLLIAASAAAFGFAGLVEKYRGTGRAKAAMIASVAVNVAVLAAFKYLPLGLDLPIGISFYTFRILTYTVDVYLGKAPVRRSFYKFLLYVSLFPQLSAGPIVRYTDMEAQLSERKTTYEGFASGALVFVCGLAKKVLLADYADKIVGILLPNAARAGTAGTWFGMLVFAFQIYFDFSGYSDMAIGLGNMFGFNVNKNFDYPYISKSVTEFWRRWHISLGAFFRDYVYIPLGGNRRAHMRNILIVWALTGLWHGKSWNFALWGLYYGVLLIAEKHIFARIKLGVPAFLRRLCTFVAALIGWVLFYNTEMRGIAAAFGAMFIYRPMDITIAQTVADNMAFAIVCLVAASPLPKNAYLKFAASVKKPIFAVIFEPLYTVATLLVCTGALVGASYSPFLYFKF